MFKYTYLDIFYDTILGMKLRNLRKANGLALHSKSEWLLHFISHQHTY